MKIYTAKLSKITIEYLKKTKEARKIARAEGTVESLTRYKISKALLRRELKKSKKLERDKKYVILNKKLIEGDARAMWQAIKWQIKLSRHGAPCNRVINQNGVPAKDSKEGLEIWREHFYKLAEPE